MDEPTSRWAALDDLREDALWAFSDLWMVERAQLRIAAVGVWLVVAAVASPGAIWWGVPALLGTALSLLHAHRPTVVTVGQRLGARSPALRRAWRWLLPYPREPHVNPVGFVEVLSLALVAGATGWLGGSFSDDPAAATAAVAATSLALASVLLNLNAHVTWELLEGPRILRLTRPAIPVAVAAVGAGLLWPGSDGNTIVQVAAVLGPLLGAGIALVAGRRLHRQAGVLADVIRRVGSHTRDLDTAFLHAAVKNFVRPVLNSVGRLEDSPLRTSIYELCYAAASAERQLRDDRLHTARSATEIVTALLEVSDGWKKRYGGADRVVSADVDPATVSERDASLLFVAVSDLFTNAATAGATTIEVSLVADARPHGADLRLTVTCDCGTPVPAPAPGSSLVRLARIVGDENGSFLIVEPPDAPGSHRFEVTWPTESRPRPLPSRVGP